MWWLLLLAIPVVWYVVTNYSSIRVASSCGACGKKADDIV